MCAHPPELRRPYQFLMEMQGKVLRRCQQQASVTADTKQRVAHLRNAAITILSFAFMPVFPTAQCVDR
jgi:hypothetical protein